MKELQLQKAKFARMKREQEEKRGSKREEEKGSEEGTVYTACRHGSRAGVLDLFEGHQAPVTGINTHNGQGTIDFSHLFLTSSIDWTVKLWSLKENKPLYSFEDNGKRIPCSAHLIKCHEK